MTSDCLFCKIVAEKLPCTKVYEDADTLAFMDIGPVVKGVTLSDKAKQRMPWGPNGSIKNLVIFNWDEVNEVRGSVVENWNKRIVGK